MPASDLLHHLALIEITNNCNLRCKHCYGFFEGNNFISINDFKFICDQLNETGVSFLTITGGEPMLLGEEIKEYINISKKTFKEVFLTTNGTLIDEDNVMFLKGLDTVQVSIDGPEKIHNSIRGRGVYQKAVRGIKILKRNNIPTSIMMTVNNYNISFFKKVYDLSQSLDVLMGFERMTSTGRGKNFLNLSKKNTKKLIGLAKKYNVESADPLCTVSNKEKRDYLYQNKVVGGCTAGTMALAIDAKMNILPCARLRIPLGNLKEKNISEILNNNKIIKKLNNRDSLKGKCGKCKYKFICGGCRASAFALTDDYMEEDPQCFYKIC